MARARATTTTQMIDQDYQVSAKVLTAQIRLARSSAKLKTGITPIQETAETFVSAVVISKCQVSFRDARVGLFGIRVAVKKGAVTGRVIQVLIIVRWFDDCCSPFSTHGC